MHQPQQKSRTLEITFHVNSEHAPALRAAIDEIRQEIGGRLEGLHRYAKEGALTRAAVALGQLAQAVNALVPSPDPEYV